MIDESIFINRRPWQRAGICLVGWMLVLPAIILWQSPSGAAPLAAAVTLPPGVDEQTVQGAAETTARGLRERTGMVVQNAGFSGVSLITSTGTASGVTRSSTRCRIRRAAPSSTSRRSP